MSEANRPAIGTIGWQDLTVPPEVATKVRDFYAGVAGWRWRDVDMGGYSDYSMLPRDGEQDVAGVCHARGVNAGLPAQWLIYIIVEDLAAAAKRCEELGGKILRPPRDRTCIIQDPAGAMCALYQTPSASR